MTAKKTLILNHQQIEHKIKRMAYQVYESNVNETEIIIAGIAKNGFVLAEKLAAALQNISDLKIELCEVKLDKKNPLAGANTSLTPDDYKNKSIILVDDVINSGKTMQYALLRLLNNPVKALKTVVLFDRQHRRYPVKANFVGLSLSTTMLDRVEVDFNKDDSKAFLV